MKLSDDSGNKIYQLSDIATYGATYYDRELICSYLKRINSDRDMNINYNLIGNNFWLPIWQIEKRNQNLHL